jgi:DNA-directed RNA polymerase specialized sigma24 family protein
MATMTRDDLVAEIPVLYRFARALVRDDDLAADLTQDTSKRHGTTTGTRSTRP